MGKKIKIDAELAIRMLTLDEAIDLLSIHTDNRKTYPYNGKMYVWRYGLQH